MGPVAGHRATRSADSRPYSRPIQPVRSLPSVESKRGAVGVTQVHIVLQPDSAPARKIDSRLHRDHRARGQRRFGRGGKPRRLVHFQPQAVAERVAERLAKSPSRDHFAGEGIGLPARSCRHAAPPSARVLGRPDEVVDGSLPLVGAGAHYHGAGEVGTVAVDLGAEIEQQPLPGAQPPVARARVGQRRARARRRRSSGNGCHSLPRRRSADSSAAAISCSVCPTRIAGQHLRQRLLREVGRRPDGGHFLRRLDRPEPLDQVAGR